jgi:cobalt/nickel transport system permease protein
MHIPDGYLSPETCTVMGAAMVPVWLIGARRVRKVVTTRYVPLLALGAAYAFLVMMFNVPIPDGTTAHAVGAVLIAIILGPWAAVIAVSVALAIQALFFGDGGILAYGANTFNMAFVMPMVGYACYRLAARNVSLTSPRRALAAGCAAYIGLNVAALCAAIEFGVQPALFHTANGTPLYAPFHLSQTIPAMALAHLTVAGLVEFALSAGVIAYLQRANLPVLRINHRGTTERDADLVASPRLGWKWGFVGLGAVAFLAPLGLLAGGGAFGEEQPDRLDLQRYHLQAVPDGLARYAGFWHHAIFSGYDFKHDAHPAVGYIVSAFVGMVVIALAILGAFAVLRRLRDRRTSGRTAVEVGA